MINKLYDNDELTLVRKDFKNSVFVKLLKKYNCSFLASKLQVSHGTIYRYKNKSNVPIPISLFKKCMILLDINLDELDKNVIKIFKPKEIRYKCLGIGRNIRKQQLKEWKNMLPHVEDLIEGNYLNLEKWFKSYLKLINFGARKIVDIKYEKNIFIVNHKNYARGKQKDFTVVLPRKIKVDDDFQYFFGLWCGDRVGGGRIGTVNKAFELNRFTADYLKNNLYQNPLFVVLKSSNISKLPNFDFKIDSVQEVKGMPGDWALCVWSVNGFLKSFFNHLYKNLDDVLNVLPDKNIFFAGLFDAEGNIFLEDSCFRWSCKNPEKVEIYKKYLRKYDLFNRYDGSSLITNNVNVFLKLIFPYLKHKEKINKSQLISTGKGYLDKKFRNILSIININQGKTVIETAKIMERKKLWPQVRFLEKYKYVKCKGYPKHVYMTCKGINELRREGQK
jgi:hypothetical protein